MWDLRGAPLDGGSLPEPSQEEPATASDLEDPYRVPATLRQPHESQPKRDGQVLEVPRVDQVDVRVSKVLQVSCGQCRCMGSTDRGDLRTNPSMGRPMWSRAPTTSG